MVGSLVDSAGATGPPPAAARNDSQARVLPRYHQEPPFLAPAEPERYGTAASQPWELDVRGMRGALDARGLIPIEIEGPIHDESGGLTLSTTASELRPGNR